MLRKFLPFLLLLLPTMVYGQSASVTGTATDSQTTPYISGTWTANLSNTSASQPIWQGTSNFLTNYGGSLDLTGSLSVTLPCNTGTNAITVGGLFTTQWKFTIVASDGGSGFTALVTIACPGPQSITASLVNAGRITFRNGEPNQPVCGIGQSIVGVSPGLSGCGGSGIAPSGGTPGQVLVSNGASPGTYQDPLISTNNMTLLSAVGATVTQTSAAVRIPIQSSSGMLVVTGSGITGSPVGCTLVLDLQQNAGAPASAAIATQAFTPNNTYQSFYISPSANFYAGDNMIAVYNCATTFPSAGTITVTFNPIAQSTLSSRGAISNGVWVDTTDVIWSQLTNLFKTGIAAPAFECCSVTSWDTTVTFRILQPNGVIYDSSANGTSWTYTQTISGGAGSNGGCGTGELFPVAGWLQSIFVYISATAGGVVQQGQVFENLYVLKSLPTGGNTASCSATFASTNGPMLLAGAPLTTFYPMSWTTGSQIGGISAQTPGAKTHFVGSNPAAGANYTFAISGNENSAIQSIHFVLVTSSQAGNRTVCLFLNNTNVNAGATVIGYYCASGVQPPSTTLQYDAMPCVAGSGGNTFQQIIALPCGFTLEGFIGEQLTIQIQGIQSSDQISNPSINALSYQIRN